MNEEKTKLIKFDKRQNQKASFNFLGFTFYWGRSNNGYKIPKMKTQGSRMRAKLKNVKVWAKSVRHKGDSKEIWRAFCKKLQGHIQYYGVSHNTERVSTFIHHAKGIMLYWLNRRSQKKSFNWGAFTCFIEMNPVPKVKIYHQLFQTHSQ